MDRILAAAVTLALCAAPLFAADAPAAAPADSSKAAAKPAAKPKAAKKAPAASGEAFKTEDERTFYAYGYRVGQNLAATTPNEAEAKAISRGVYDAVTSKPEAVSMAIYLPKVGDMATKRILTTEKAKGAAAADKFSKEDGVKPIPVGGFIKILTEGTGPSPKAEDTVKVNYRGTLLDGKEFDSSYSRKEPTTFPLANVIPCWTNGVAMMKVGGKAKLLCPSDVAYGDQGNPRGGILPGATLNFEIELLEIVKPEPTKIEVKADGKPAKKP